MYSMYVHVHVYMTVCMYCMYMLYIPIKAFITMIEKKILTRHCKCIHMHIYTYLYM